MISMKVKLMKLLNNIEIEALVSYEVNYREMLDDSKPGRIIEKLVCGSKTILLKYGTDDGMKNEVRTYQQIGNFNANIPAVIFCEQINSLSILMLDWIEGRYPDFHDNKDIELYFHSLGRFAVESSNQFDDENFDYNKHLKPITELQFLLQKKEEFIKNTVGALAYDRMQQLMAHKENILISIRKMPEALDPGDISLHNAKIAGDTGEVVLFDFESAAVRPLCMFFEHFGESYESIPSSEAGIHLSIQTFFRAWNTYANIQISWSDFMHSVIAAMLNYKAGNYVYWIRRIMSGIHDNETILWIKNDVQIVEKLLLELDEERWNHWW